MFRADLLLTGILFERQVDAHISFHTGPFRDSRCRLDDWADSKRMSMGNAFRDRPAFGVFGPRSWGGSGDWRGIRSKEESGRVSRGIIAAK
jgi:hypothetical protein